MALHVDSRFDYRDAFALEEFFLERGIGLADQELAGCAENAVPGDAFSGGRGGHGAAGAAGATAEAQKFGDGPIG